MYSSCVLDAGSLRLLYLLERLASFLYRKTLKKRVSCSQLDYFLFSGRQAGGSHGMIPSGFKLPLPPILV